MPEKGGGYSGNFSFGFSSSTRMENSPSGRFGSRKAKLHCTKRKERSFGFVKDEGPSSHIEPERKKNCLVLLLVVEKKP